MHSCLWQSRLSATSDINISQSTNLRASSLRAHIFRHTHLSKLGNPIWGWGGDMHKDVCILSVRVVQPRHVANIAPAVYKHMYTCILPAVVIERTNNDGWVAIWGQRAPIVRSRPPWFTPLTNFCLLRRVHRDCRGFVLGRPLNGGSWSFPAIGKVHRLALCIPTCGSSDFPPPLINILQSTNTRASSLRAHICIHMHLSKLGNPIWGWGGGHA